MRENDFKYFIAGNLVIYVYCLLVTLHKLFLCQHFVKLKKFYFM